MATDFAQCIFLSQEGYDVIIGPLAAYSYEAKGLYQLKDTINNVLSESFCAGTILRQPNSGKIYRKLGRADCGNDFSNTLQRLCEYIIQSGRFYGILCGLTEKQFC